MSDNFNIFYKSLLFLKLKSEKQFGDEKRFVFLLFFLV